MLYSSGTTGRPKGILRPLPPNRINDGAGSVGDLQKQLWNFNSDTVYLSPAPLYHSAPLGFYHRNPGPRRHGVMMPKFDPVLALQAIEDHRVTHSQWVPTMFSRMLKLPEDERAGTTCRRTRLPSTRPRRARSRSNNRCSTGGVRSCTSTTAAPK